MRTLVSRGVLVTTLLLAGVFPAGATQLIESHMAQLREQGRLTLGGQQLAAVRALPAFYAARDYQPVWSSGDRARDMLQLIEAATADGLNPTDYHAGALRELSAQGQLGEEARAHRELLLTDALMRLVYHLEFGKVDAEKLYNNWQFAKSIDGLDPVGLIETIVNAPVLSASIDAHRPQHPVYARLQEALAHYQQLADAGGWKSMPAGPTLKTGMRDPRVRSLRQRLMVSGDLASDLTVTELFDAALEAAVKRFQERHRLNPDGAVGAGTLKALNVSAGKRVDQLRVNLERARWILHDISAEMIIADIAGFEVFEIRNGDITWRTRAQVGKTYRKTPVFKSEIKYLEFNPTWTIPPTILRKDILPKVKKDPGYLSAKSIRVLDQQGRSIDVGAIDWSRYPGEGFPYILRQDPGPKNALGRIKFIFPNPHFVYMHDTPSKALFDREQRTFSSGCIRIQKPFEFAERLLADPQRWNQQTIQQVLDSRKTTRVNLPEPVPVALMYWTAGTEPDGSVFFKADPYDRDAAVLAALNSAPVFTPPAERGGSR
ncbi:MAG: L,D-transpeptidase family protein [Gammaproteobacteria bacterium]|nr:L,D-transpeptidase family protein [Gammaproteobacteria bacterium]